MDRGRVEGMVGMRTPPRAEMGPGPVKLGFGVAAETTSMSGLSELPLLLSVDVPCVDAGPE